MNRGVACTERRFRITKLGTSRSIQPVAQRATRGAIALLVRQVFVYASTILGGILLARLLSPSEFGFYGVAMFALVFLNVFGGTGFAANLIRLPDDPTLHDKRVVYTAQECVVACVFLAIWLAAPHLTVIYHIPSQGILFFRLMGVSLFLTSLMVMPQIQLERDLAFDKLAMIEVSQAVVFNGMAVLLAWRGVGILSFSIALVLRSGCGAILATAISPWKIGIKWDYPALKKHIHFGVALQGGNILSTVKDSITPVFIGMYLGAAYVGYVTWANSLATYSVAILMPLQRLYLPFFAKFQQDRAQLARYVSHTLWMANAVAAPLTLVTVALAHPITTLIFGAKWLYALPLFYLLIAGNLFVPCSAPMLGLLNALGKARITFLVLLMWMASTWIFGVPFTLVWSLRGFGFAMVCVSLTNLVLYWVVWKELRVNPVRAYWPSWPLAAAVSCSLYLIQLFRMPSSVWELAAYTTAALAVYIGALTISSPSQVAVLRRILRGTA